MGRLWWQFRNLTITFKLDQINWYFLANSCCFRFLRAGRGVFRFDSSIRFQSRFVCQILFSLKLSHEYSSLVDVSANEIKRHRDGISLDIECPSSIRWHTVDIYVNFHTLFCGARPCAGHFIYIAGDFIRLKYNSCLCCAPAKQQSKQ